MFAQLGNTEFDAQKSFVAFSEDEEVVVVEHALIARKPKLQGTGIGLRSLNLSLYLHQEFCNVLEETENLLEAKNSFEVLPLLWGNGRVEGDFIMTSFNRTITQMDADGNTVAVSINLTLKENGTHDKKEQQKQEAQKNAIAVGDKQPPEKSPRINPPTCNKKVADLLSIIKANAGRLDEYSRKYTNDPSLNNKIVTHLNIVAKNAQLLFDTYQDPDSCVASISNFGGHSGNVKVKAEKMRGDIQANNVAFTNTFLPVNVQAVKNDNTALQSDIKILLASANKLIKASIANK